MAEQFDRDEFERWLKTQPREVSLAIASRAALRVMPLLGIILEVEELDDAGWFGSVVLLPLLRGMALPWAAAIYPAHGREFAASATANTVSASAASNAAYTAARAANAAFAAANAAAAAAYSAVAAENDAYAANAVSAAADAYGTARAAAAAAAARAAAADRKWIEAGGSAADLGVAPFWPARGMPDELRRLWERLKSELRPLDEDWQVWTDWYEDRLRGETPVEALEVERVTLPEDLWEEGPKAVNARIRELIEGAPEPEVQSASRQDRERSELVIPEQKRAALEPVWRDGRLTLAAGTLPSGHDSIDAALTALKRDFERFLDVLKTDTGNVDSRFVDYFEQVTESIPTAAPSQEVLFSLAHNEEILIGYGKAVSSEWPDFLAAQYHGLALHFGRIMRQFPEWREFLENARGDPLSEADIEAAAEIGTAFADGLRDETPNNPVDAIIPDVIEKFAGELSAPQETPSEETASGRSLLARDLLESVNNTLKRLFEAAAPVLRRAGKVVYAEFVEGAFHQLKMIARAAGRGVVIGVAGYAGSVIGEASGLLAYFAARFPEIYGWIEPWLKFFPWV
ncbi:hypothetical protein [Breoghania sp. L-A4]|uniref:hypothetical protein n=1 Tax=Breoghania sp. L-A4 TaxID=2304600 RepID=UPI000E35CDD6|nr:hypothetical protein [Breoghania sp. L-A4]AXS39920.1 hypothetical protein D1F64_07450 [Breoghania sp. L-A4]